MGAFIVLCCVFKIKLSMHITVLSRLTYIVSSLALQVKIYDCVVVDRPGFNLVFPEVFVLFLFDG